MRRAPWLPRNLLWKFPGVPGAGSRLQITVNGTRADIRTVQMEGSSAVLDLFVDNTKDNRGRRQYQCEFMLAAEGLGLDESVPGPGRLVRVSAGLDVEPACFKILGTA